MRRGSGQALGTPRGSTAPQAGRQHGQHSRLQRSDEGVGVRSLWQLAALLPAQADDVTQSLRSVGLPLEKRGHSSPRRAGVPFCRHTRPHGPARGSGGAACRAASSCDQTAADARNVSCEHLKAQESLQRERRHAGLRRTLPTAPLRRVGAGQARPAAGGASW